MKWYFWAIIGIAIVGAGYFGYRILSKKKIQTADKDNDNGVADENTTTVVDETTTEEPVVEETPPTVEETSARLFAVAN